MEEDFGRNEDREYTQRVDRVGCSLRNFKERETRDSHMRIEYCERRIPTEGDDQRIEQGAEEKGVKKKECV